MSVETKATVSDFMAKHTAQLKKHDKPDSPVIEKPPSAAAPEPAIKAPKPPKEVIPVKTSLDLAAAVASNNRTAPHLKGLRFHKGTVKAANLNNQIEIKDALDKSIDCVVDSESFIKAWKGIKSPVLEQSEHVLTVRSQTGKSKVDLMFMDKKSMKSILEDADMGETVELKPQGLLEAAKRLIPFLKLTKTHIWVYEKFLYVVDRTFMVRTPVDAEIPDTVFGKKTPMTFSQEFVDLLNGVESKPLKITIGKDLMVVEFEDCTVKTIRYALAPLEILGQFEKYMPEKTQELPIEVVEALKSMIGFADKADQVTFGPMGVSLMKAGKASWSIAHPMPTMSFGAKNLKHVLDHGSLFNFDNPSWIVFKNEHLEGIWMAQNPESSDDDQTEGPEETYEEEPEAENEPEADDNDPDDYE